mgnify:CR=1 FL=1
MKFVMSYSCGKDSTLALHRMVAAGHEPVALLAMYNREAGRSWFHGVEDGLLAGISRSLGLPLLRCACGGEDYQQAMEAGLGRARALGATACAFGDIDIEEHRQWDRARCEAAGLEMCLPLWQRNRLENTMEVLNLGYRCVIKCVRNDALPSSYLGRILDQELVADMQARGIDVCGENGEYHTVTVDGPLFQEPVAYRLGEVLELGQISVIDLRAG